MLHQSYRLLLVSILSLFHTAPLYAQAPATFSLDSYKLTDGLELDSLQALRVLLTCRSFDNGGLSKMRGFMFLVVLVSSLIGTSHSAQSKPPRKKNLNSPLRLVAKAKSGTDYNKKQYTSYSWYIKNIGARNVWLPLPKDRFQSKSTPPRYFQFRTRVSGSWSLTRLGDHEIDYEADWIVLQPGELRQLFTTTFSEEGDSFEAIEVSVIYRDDRGKIHKEKLSWLKSHRLR